MSNIKISELSEITEIPANTENLLLIVTDTTPIVPVSRKIKFSTIYDYVDDVALQAQQNANLALQTCNTITNNVNALSLSLENKINLAYTQANSAYELSNNITSIFTYRVDEPPETRLGKEGDKVGMFYLSEQYLYFCTQNYDVSSNIWSRIQTTNSW